MSRRRKNIDDTRSNPHDSVDHQLNSDDDDDGDGNQNVDRRGTKRKRHQESENDGFASSPSRTVDDVQLPRVSLDKNSVKRNQQLLQDAIQQKLNIEEELIRLEQQIYNLEGSYMEDTGVYGNVLKGFDNFLSNKQRHVSGTATATTTTTTTTTGGGVGGGRRVRIRDQDRIFSNSSSTSAAAVARMQYEQQQQQQQF